MEGTPWRRAQAWEETRHVQGISNSTRSQGRTYVEGGGDKSRSVGRILIEQDTPENWCPLLYTLFFTFIFSDFSTRIHSCRQKELTTVGPHYFKIPYLWYINSLKCIYNPQSILAVLAWPCADVHVCTQVVKTLVVLYTHPTATRGTPTGTRGFSSHYISKYPFCNLFSATVLTCLCFVGDAAF